MSGLLDRTAEPEGSAAEAGGTAGVCRSRPGVAGV